MSEATVLQDNGGPRRRRCKDFFCGNADKAGCTKNIRPSQIQNCIDLCIQQRCGRIL